jgi:hypothetical protein
MHTTYVVVTVIAAFANFYAASNDFVRPAWIVQNMSRLAVPQSRLGLLGILKIAGGIGLLAGFWVPVIGVVAGSCLVVFFIGAIGVAIRAKWPSHIPFPTVWLVLAGLSLALRLATR